MSEKLRSANVWCLDTIDYNNRHQIIDQAFSIVPPEHRHTAQIKVESFNGYVEFGVYWTSPLTAAEHARAKRLEQVA